LKELIKIEKDSLLRLIKKIRSKREGGRVEKKIEKNADHMGKSPNAINESGPTFWERFWERPHPYP